MRAEVGTKPADRCEPFVFRTWTAGWTTVTNQDFSFPDQTATWRIFSLFIDASTVSGLVGDTIGVGGRLNESPNTQYGWLWVDWVQLAPAIPYFTTQPQNATNFAGASASISASAVGAVTNSSGPGVDAAISVVQGARDARCPMPPMPPWFSQPSTQPNAGDYYVVATGPYGSSQSSNAALVVLPSNPPIVTQPPQSRAPISTKPCNSW